MRILVTGGAGCIGSNIIEVLLRDERVTQVRCIDDYSTGFEKNIQAFRSNPKFQFRRGDIREYKICLELTQSVDKICHQAALGSIPRSIANPLKTHAVNLNGTFNIFQAAVHNKVERVVFASSSLVYGDSTELPKKEGNIGKPLSPYAVTKQTAEIYAEVFSKVYPFRYFGLRYINVFGPRQASNGPYAAVIPLFIRKALNKEVPTINGNGDFSRDFTYVSNVVGANLLALFSEIPRSFNQIYNVATGKRTTINTLWDCICDLTGNQIEPLHGPERQGDIPHSQADISKAGSLLKYVPQADFKDSVKKTINYFKYL